MSKKHKIAIILHGLGANGIDSLFANLSAFWDLEVFDITYFLAVDKDNTQFWENIVLGNGVKVIHITDLDHKKIVKFPFLLYKALKLYGPFDAIHANMDMLNGILLLIGFLAKIKTRICHAHTSSNVMPTSFWRRFIKHCYLNVMRLLIRIFSTKRIACSDIAASYFYGSLSYDLLYNGIDLQHYGSFSPSPSTDPRFISVGRLEPPKNPFFLVDVIHELKKIEPTISLDWIGDGSMLPSIKQYTRQKGLTNTITFHGLQKNVAAYLRNARFFLLPSLYEGLSLALAEAQAAGLLCFVSDMCSHMSDCGRCIFLPLSEDASYWAKQIASFIGKSTPEIDENKIAQFDIRRTSKILENLYLD